MIGLSANFVTLVASSYHEPVGDSDLVEEALFPVNKKRVRNPDLGQEGPV